MRGDASLAGARRRAFVASAGSLAACAFAGAITDVVCVVGVVSNFGTAPLLAVWVVDSVIVIAFAGAIASFVDRVNRSRTLAFVLGAAAILHVLVAGVFFFGLRAEIAYGSLLALSRIDANVAVTFGWAVARDHFDFEAAVKQFSRLSVIGVVAGCIGTALATRLISREASAIGIAGIAVLFAMAALFALRAPRMPTRKSSIPPPLPMGSSLPPPGLPGAAIPLAAPPAVTHLDALRFVFREGAFRRLAIFGLVNGSAHSIVGYEVLRALEKSGDALTDGYGLLRFAEPLVLTLVQAFGAPTLLARAGIRGTFVAPSLAIAAASVGLACSERPAWAIALSLVMNAAFGFEYAGFSAALTALPSRLRARTSVLLDGTVYNVGYINGVLLVLCSSFVAKVVGRDVAQPVALGTAFVLGAVGLGFALTYRPGFERT